jgi:hypothetical protein
MLFPSPLALLLQPKLSPLSLSLSRSQESRRVGRFISILHFVFWVAFCHLRKTHHHLYHFRLLKCIYIYIYIFWFYQRLLFFYFLIGFCFYLYGSIHYIFLSSLGIIIRFLISFLNIYLFKSYILSHKILVLHISFTYF